MKSMDTELPFRLSSLFHDTIQWSNKNEPVKLSKLVMPFKTDMDIIDKQGFV